LPITVTVYLSSANISENETYPCTVAPTTSIGNGGVTFASIPNQWGIYIGSNGSGTSILECVYPINSIYIGYSHTSPAELFGGTWHRIESRFLWGTPSTGTIGATAGEQTHVLTSSEMPNHIHEGIYYSNANGKYHVDLNAGSNGYKLSWTNNAGKGVAELVTGSAGGGAAHNNMPPYVNVAIWRRIA
jgi:microcystin-dependent protein